MIDSVPFKVFFNECDIRDKLFSPNLDSGVRRGELQHAVMNIEHALKTMNAIKPRQCLNEEFESDK